jgi:hypothetical protein
MLLDKPTDFTHTAWWKTVLHSQFNHRLQPELRVPMCSFDMHMHALLFEGEEAKTENPSL